MSSPTVSYTLLTSQSFMLERTVLCDVLLGQNMIELLASLIYLDLDLTFLGGLQESSN